jgi:hypothetical protein
MAFVMLTWVLFRAQSFDAAIRIYEGLFGFTDWGTGLRWRSVALAAVVALIGPTGWAAAQDLKPHRWSAAAFAVLFVLVLYKIGDDANYEFIYFQF